MRTYPGISCVVFAVILERKTFKIRQCSIKRVTSHLNNCRNCRRGSREGDFGSVQCVFLYISFEEVMSFDFKRCFVPCWSSDIMLKIIFIIKVINVLHYFPVHPLRKSGWGPSFARLIKNDFFKKVSLKLDLWFWKRFFFKSSMYYCNNNPPSFLKKGDPFELRLIKRWFAPISIQWFCRNIKM